MSKTKQAIASEDLGEFAQRTVGLWAATAGLLPIEPSPDRDGWDFHFHCRPTLPAEGSSFFDALPPAFSCFAQVKGTTKRQRRFAVTLNHWHRASTIPVPWVFVVLEYDGGTEPARAFVVHVNREVVERVAKRLREASAKAQEKKKPPPKLHKLTMALAWTDADEVALGPEGLRERLLSITNDATRYAAEKIEWWPQAGADTRRNEIQLFLQGTSDALYDDLSEWAIGHTNELVVDELRRTEYRFDIPERFPPQKTDIRLSSNQLVLARTTATIAGRTSLERVALPVEVFSSLSIFPFLPRQHWKLRLRCGLLSFVIAADADGMLAQMSVTKSDAPVAFLLLMRMAVALRLLRQPSTLSFDIQYRNGPRTHKHELTGTAVASEIDRMGVFEVVGMLAAQFGLPDDASGRPHEILEDRIAVAMFGAIACEAERAGAVIEARMSSVADLAVGTRVRVLMCEMLRLGDYLLVAALVLDGPLEETKSTESPWRVTSRPVVVRRWATPWHHAAAWRRVEFPQLHDALLREVRSEAPDAFLIDQGFIPTAPVPMPMIEG